MKLDASIFVAGHAGLIGSAVVRRLKDSGYRKILTRRRSELDLTNAADVARFFCDHAPEIVILAAGRVGGIVENQTYPADFMEENVAIQLNVLRAARLAGTKKFVMFGSSCMYPRDCEQPMAEQKLLTGIPEPTSLPYAISKLTGTYICLAYNKQYGGRRFLPVIPNSAYGPNDNFEPGSGHVLSALMAKFHDAKEKRRDAVVLWGSGSARREFVHADDIADACFHLLNSDACDMEFPVNIGVGHDISIKELSGVIASIVGYEGRIEWDQSKPEGAPRKLLDSTRLRSSGWQPKISLVEGLRSTYAWYTESLGRRLTANEY